MIKLLYLPSLWVKIIRAKGSLSYQSHEHRTEYVIGVFKVEPGVKHRYTKGLYLEIATGRPDEADIIRYEDDFNRV